MNPIAQPLRMILLAVMALVIAAPARGDVTTVTLKSTARISGDQPITLGQIGVIEGDQSERLGGIVIGDLLQEQSDGWQQLDAVDLRVMIQSEPGLLAGSIVIRGAGVMLRRIDATSTGASSAQAAAPEPQSEQSKGPMIRSHIERWINDRYRIGESPVRISFRELDEEFLQTPTDGRLVEIREISKRGRTAIRVVLIDEFTIVAEQALMFDVQVLRPVLIARDRIDRGTILDESHFMSEDRWVSPEEQAIDAGEAMGMAIAKTINQGQLLQVQHIEMPLVIRRGDIVSAKSIAGSVVVTIRGRAKSNARQGEILEIESMSGETEFSARAVGKGRALIIRDADLDNEELALSERNGA